MFSVIAVIILVAIGALLTFVAFKCKLSGDRGVALFFAAVFYAIATIWFACATAGTYTNQLKSFTNIKKTRMQIILDTERRDKLISILKLELSKYPEIEKEIIMNIKPDMMLLSQFPKLKSNETIVEMVNSIMVLENSVYEKRFCLIDLQRESYYREISPWVIFPVVTYANFFKEENSFAK